MLRLPGGGVLVAATAVVVITLQFNDLNSLASAGWLRIYYITVGGLVLIAATADAIVQRLTVGRDAARGHGNRAWR